MLKSPVLFATDKVLVAELLQADADPFVHRVVLDKGAKNDVYIGQPVLDAGGIMGQIIEVGPVTSVALLITDVSHALPVETQRNGARSIAVGTGSWHELELSHVTPTMDVQVGDELVTSGLGKRFARGYPVGAVESVTAEAGQLFVRVKVRPTAQLDKSREVLLIWPANAIPEPAAAKEKDNAKSTQ